jgi:hypothetical protein
MSLSVPLRNLPWEEIDSILDSGLHFALERVVVVVGAWSQDGLLFDVFSEFLKDKIDRLKRLHQSIQNRSKINSH